MSQDDTREAAASEIVERVALAIWKAREETFPSRVRRPVPDAIDQASGAWSAICIQARAAIEAMREHTLVYRDAGQVVHELRGAPDDIWKTLLDAALGSGGLCR